MDKKNTATKCGVWFHSAITGIAHFCHARPAGNEDAEHGLPDEPTCGEHKENYNGIKEFVSQTEHKDADRNEYYCPFRVAAYVLWVFFVGTCSTHKNEPSHRHTYESDKSEGKPKELEGAGTKGAGTAKGTNQWSPAE